MKAFNAAPSLLWWAGPGAGGGGNIDSALDAIACAGLALSGFLVVWGAGNAVVFTLLWVLYHSLVNVGQRWYSMCVMIIMVDEGSASLCT